MLKFIIDTQLPSKLATHLEGLETDAVHTTNYLSGHLMADKEIIQKAVDEERIVVSKDADFRDYFLVKGSPPKILLLKTGNISNKDLFRLITTSFPTIQKLFDDGNGMLVLSTENITGYMSA